MNLTGATWTALLKKYGDVTLHRVEHEGRVYAAKTVLKLDADLANKEIGFIKTFNHPNVVKFFGRHDAEDTISLILEMYDQSLYQLVNNTYVSYKNIRKIMRGILEGLAYIHGKGIVHCDLKLSNIMVTKTLDAKIIDFDCGKTFSEAENSPGIATQGYCAPEFEDGHPNTPASDMWAVAKMLDDLLSSAPWYATDEELDEYEEKANKFLSRIDKKDPKARLTAEEALKDPFFA